MAAFFDLSQFRTIRSDMLIESPGNSVRPEIMAGEGGVDSRAIFAHLIDRLSRILDTSGQLEKVQEPQDWLRRELAALLKPIVSFEIRETGHFRIAIDSIKQWGRPLEFYRDGRGLVRRLSEELILDRRALGQVIERIEHLFELRLGLNPGPVIQQSLIDILSEIAPRMADVRFLRKPVDSPHPAVRASACRALAKLAVASEDYLAGRALHPLGPKIFVARQEALAVLAAKAESCDDPEELEAVILPSLAAFQWTAVPHLARLLESATLDVRCELAMVRVLASLGEVSRPAVPVLRSFLKCEEMDLKLEASIALMSIGIEDGALQEEIFAVADLPGASALRELLDTGWYVSGK